MDRFAHVYKGAPPDHCCCDQALRALACGEWIVVFMTGGAHEPEEGNYVAISRSLDRGANWIRPLPVQRSEERAWTLSEVIVRGQGVLVFLASHQGRFEDWRVHTSFSPDGGRTWQIPQPFGPAPRRAFIRNLYVASWGEWYLPLQHYPPTGAPTASPLEDGSFAQCRNGVLISGDSGGTWQASPTIGPTAGWAENNVVETRNGAMVMLIRADGRGCLLRSDSSDRGRTWSQPVATDIPNPGSKFRLFRLRDGRIALLHNASSQLGVRNPLALWVSEDDMANWSHRRVLTQFPGQLQYPDGFVDESDHTINFAFDYNRHDVIFWSAKLPGV